MNKKGFGVLTEVLEQLGESVIEKVISSTDKNLINDYFYDIKKMCQKHNVPFFHRNDEFVVSTNYSIAIGWRWLIDGANSKLIVLHDSKLPKYRGFAPLVNALINKEPSIGVTALYASDKYDCGDIILQKSVPIEYPIKVVDAIGRVSALYQDLVVNIIRKIYNSDPLKGYEQDESNATYSLWRDEADYQIDWAQDADEVMTFINAVGYPYKGAYTWLNEEKVRIFEATIVPDVIIENRTPGKVIFIEEGNPILVCEKGLLRVTNAIFDINGKSALPLKLFRSRFENKK